MKREIIPPVTLTSLANLKVRWGVSIAALLLRARHLGIISERQWKYCINKKEKVVGIKKSRKTCILLQKNLKAFKKMIEVLHGFPVSASKVSIL